MKKVPFIFLLLFVGCAGPGREDITYTRNSQEMTLKITHYNNGASCTITIKNANEAKQYRERMEKLIKELQDFEKELSVREKGN